MRFFAAVALLVLAACANTQSDPSPSASGAGTQVLFDGTSTDAWRGYNKPDLPAGWQIVDGALTRVGAGGDIVTKNKYRNFDLTLDWNIAPGGNSGVFYRGVETSDPIYYSAPEMQVLDDERHADGKSLMTSSGSNFGLYPTQRGIVKPAGQWNSARLVVNGNHVEHWLNGTKVVEYELHSADWKQRVAGSKFNAWKAYGMAPEGHIGLQDHGDRVAFRNIRIRVLP